MSEENKVYTPREAALGVLERIKQIAMNHLAKGSESLNKTAPQNQNAADMAGLKVPQPKAPEAPTKIIPSKKELKLKKFMDNRNKKKLQKDEK